MRRQFLDMMGLWPLPPRTALKPVITGKLTTPHYRVEKLHYQSMPGLYVTANLYLPLKVEKPAPAVLYVCGHGAVIKDKVSYGNKVTYQHHGAWLAEHGYVCLIVDTLQLGEIQGIHHGLYRRGMWWWVSMGYTPAGVELWNGMRGLDYLCTRPEVDKERLGVAGRSGGGATSWWVMAADERVKAAVPVAGIADLRAHVSEGSPGRLRAGVVAGHCDCMYMHNTYRWDYTQVIALCAPRATLLGNSDADYIFPMPGYRRMAAKVRKLYGALGVAEKFDLLETKGPHKDTPELRDGEYRWMNRWLKGERVKIEQPDRERFTPQQLKVLDKAPADAINAVVHERFRRAAKLEIPAAEKEAREWWKVKAGELKKALQERCFRGWPEKPGPLNAKVAGTAVAHGVRLTAVSYVSEEGVPLRAWVLTPAKAGKLKELMVEVCDEEQWKHWLAVLGPEFKGPLHEGGNPAPVPYPAMKPGALRSLKASMDSYGWGFAFIAPRGVGPTRWDDDLGKPHVLRRFILLGQTLDGQRVWDVRRGLSALEAVPGVKGAKVELQGTGTMAGVALYAALFEPGVKRVRLTHPPASHREGPTFFNVLTVLDMPQAVALAGRDVVVEASSEEEAKKWAWPLELQKKLGEKKVEVKVEKE
jgi:cephalosporin-C deacetylase-like acetyl esterase